MATARSRYYSDSVMELSDEVLRCKSFGHAWDVGPVSRFSPVGREVWVVRLRCTSCGMERTDFVEPGTFELEERRYTRVEGYTLLDGGGRVECREEVIRRAYDRQGRKDPAVSSERVPT